jgi:hypothetical protein
MSTNSNGDLVELKVMAAFAEHSWEPLVPFSDSLRFDFMAYNGQKTKKVQVKNSWIDENGAHKTHLYSTAPQSDGTVKRHHYDGSVVDLIAMYVPSRDDILTFSPEDFGGQVRFRFEDEFDGQNSPLINWGNNYLLE